MRYTTRYYGAPYGRDGERGEDVTPGTAMAHARRRLCAGQRMDIFPPCDAAQQSTPIRRIVCDRTGGVMDVAL